MRDRLTQQRCRRGAFSAERARLRRARNNCRRAERADPFTCTSRIGAHAIATSLRNWGWVYPQAQENGSQALVKIEHDPEAAQREAEEKQSEADERREAEEALRREREAKMREDAANREQLITATRWGRSDEVRQLLDNGVDVNCKEANGAGVTALFTAVVNCNGNPKILRMLLKAGAETDVCDKVPAARPPPPFGLGLRLLPTPSLTRAGRHHRACLCCAMGSAGVGEAAPRRRCGPQPGGQGALSALSHSDHD